MTFTSSKVETRAPHFIGLNVSQIDKERGKKPSEQQRVSLVTQMHSTYMLIVRWKSLEVPTLKDISRENVTAILVKKALKSL